MTVSEIKRFGNAAGADILVLGKISRLDQSEFDLEKGEELLLQISLRFISTQNGSTLGMVTKT